MTKVINHFSNDIPALFLIAGNFAHSKVSLWQDDTFGVNSYKNVCDLLNIQFMGEIDHTTVIIFNAFQAGNDIGDFGHSLAVSNSVFWK